MKLAWMIVLGSMLSACSDDDTPPARPAYTICDGSDGVRLSMVSAGGQLAETYAFTNPFGWRFLYIDGHCNFVASTDVDGQLRSGSFTPEQGATIADGLGLEDTAGLIYRSRGACPDAPINRLTTTLASIQSGCGDDAPPARVERAMHWEPALALAQASGQLATGALSVLAIADHSKLPVEAMTSWPFGFSIAEVDATGARFEDVPRRARSLTGADAALARQLWERGRATALWRGAVLVSDQGKSYRLYFRDDLEPTFAAQIADFGASYGYDGARTLARCEGSRILDVSLADARVYGRVFDAQRPAGTPCGAELCWDGDFDESAPVQAHVLLQRPAEPRTCEGSPSLQLSADLQPLIDAYRASYPGRAVRIDLGVGTLEDASEEDAHCGPLAVQACAADPRCRTLDGVLNDGARQCHTPSQALGCGAKFSVCDDSITGGQAPDGRRAVFTSTCIPLGWTAFHGEAADYTLPACSP